MAQARAGRPAVKQSYALGVAPREIADPGDGGAIPTLEAGYLNFVVGAGAETRTLPDPTFIGQRLDAFMSVRGGGSITITAASAVNQSGHTSILFDAAGEHWSAVAILDAAGAFAWRTLVANGATVS